MTARTARVGALLLAALSASCSPAAHRDAAPASPVRTAPVPVAEPAPVAEPVARAVPAPSALLAEAPVLPPGTYVATARRDTLDIWRRPALRSRGIDRFDPVNPIGQDLAFLVTEAMRDDAGAAWLRILVPERPNGATGWIRRGDVELRRVRERIVVDLSDRSLVQIRRGRTVHRFTVGIGTAATPTATGRFYIWARVPQADPAGPYGVYALGLSGFSEVLLNWPGGGRMAIHGTSDPSDRGQMVSHGCIRVFNPQMRLLERVPLGTPVVIRP
jgi:lipoprotein-anchoring transpeptidase ErfK/SrfK